MTGIPPVSLQQNIAVVAGTRVKLMCNIGSRGYTKQWLKDDAILYSRGKLENIFGSRPMYTIDTGDNLLIKRALMVHAGKYDCKDTASSVGWSLEVIVFGGCTNCNELTLLMSLLLLMMMLLLSSSSLPSSSSSSLSLSSSSASLFGLK